MKLPYRHVIIDETQDLYPTQPRDFWATMDNRLGADGKLHNHAYAGPCPNTRD